MAERWSSPKQVGSQEQHLCPLRLWSEDVLSQGKKPVARKPLEAISPVTARFFALPELFSNMLGGDDSPEVLTELFFNFLGVECFQGPHESFVQGLHFVDVVRCEANDVNMILSS